MKTAKQKSFTLVELLMVITVIGILAAVVIVSLAAARQRSRDARRLADIDSVRTAIELYYDNNDEYPINAGSWSYSFDGAGDVANWIPVSAPDLVPTYLPNLPMDPLNDDTHKYGYITNDDGSGKATEYKLVITSFEASSNQAKATSDGDGGNDDDAYELYSPGGRDLGAPAAP